jgi:1-acyl-sn-glycerol-3-phosphate acyltransferase
MKAYQRRGKPFYGPDAPGWGFLWCIKYGIAWILLVLFRIRVIGKENLVPGGAILAANHVSMLDSVLLFTTHLGKQPHFVAKSELYDLKIGQWKALAWFLDKVGTLPVNRGTADRAMINQCTDLLNAGEWVCIFPEGTRKTAGVVSAEMGEAMGGAAFLSARTDVPVIPIGIGGTEHIMIEGNRFPRFPRVTYIIGEPIYPHDFEGKRKERVTNMTNAIMEQIKALRDQARAL